MADPNNRDKWKQERDLARKIVSTQYAIVGVESINYFEDDNDIFVSLKVTLICDLGKTEGTIHMFNFDEEFVASMFFFESPVYNDQLEENQEFVRSKLLQWAQDLLEEGDE